MEWDKPLQSTDLQPIPGIPEIVAGILPPNSPQMIRKYYMGLVTPEAAKLGFPYKADNSAESCLARALIP
jgi:hypothetical protein